MDKLRVINNPPETEIQAVDVVAVHGVAGYKTSTWESLDPGTISYVECFSGRSIVRVSVYEYHFISKGANAFTRLGLRAEALEMLEAISMLQGGKQTNIVFVRHDIGGLLIKEALIQAAFGHDADDQHNEGELENVEGKEYSSDDGDLKGDD
ncbi:hypothetical protein BDV35DRAFT_393843 [Aspergillus flavus]|uniref:Uncharacterized protein n=2 Tax=Aspergillus subgen. Circumdati TaxID=2720871 RepID=A0A1S9DGK0_ASPOZ|nr:hypothetical protein BDV35DRAFT_393843 [Aspergillus flavus]OOO08205.1 hypothetical protein OAory_01047050 [Aspergillus oryzae]